MILKTIWLLNSLQKTESETERSEPKLNQTSKNPIEDEIKQVKRKIEEEINGKEEFVLNTARNRNQRHSGAAWWARSIGMKQLRRETREMREPYSFYL